MSFADYLRGATTTDFFNEIARRRDERDADAAIDAAETNTRRWKRHAMSLDAMTCTAIGVANGRKDAIDELVVALRELNPNHPLLGEGGVDAIVNIGAAEYAHSKGYRFDPATRTCREIS